MDIINALLIGLACAFAEMILGLAMLAIICGTLLLLENSIKAHQAKHPTSNRRKGITPQKWLIW